MPSPDARVVQLVLTGGAFVDLPVERLLAACDPVFRRELAARSKEAVAAAAGMARSNYARLEAARHQPKLETLKRVARALGVPLATFFERQRTRVRKTRPEGRGSGAARAGPA